MIGTGTLGSGKTINLMLSKPWVSPMVTVKKKWPTWNKVYRLVDLIQNHKPGFNYLQITPKQNYRPR